MALREYKINVDESVLEDLYRRLDNTRWPEEIPGVEWEYGANYNYIRSLCDYWRNDYDWRKWEDYLNQYPQYICEINGIDVHFWHVKAAKENAKPVLLLHGWPGSALEFFGIIDKLTDPEAHGGGAEDALDVVIPDLPGFGWSGKPKERGWGADRIALTLDQLMTEVLNYPKYGVQGGDWGAMIAARIGSNVSEHVLGLHINYTMLPIPVLDDLSEEDMAVCKQTDDFDFWGGAYHLVQETKADMVTMAQTDSPAGLATWIVEKFYCWSDCNNDIESKFSKDILLTNLMFYWAPNSVASAARIYYESFHNPKLNWGAPNPKIPAPTAVARFPKDPFHRPRGWVEKHYNLKRWTEMPSGGHFPGLEEPEYLAEDLLSWSKEW